MSDVAHDPFRGTTPGGAPRKRTAKKATAKKRATPKKRAPKKRAPAAEKSASGTPVEVPESKSEPKPTDATDSPAVKAAAEQAEESIEQKEEGTE